MRLRPVPDIAPRAVLYLRQSVHRDDSISMELQEIAGRDYCTQHGYEVVAVERDEGMSGRNWSKRPAVQRALDLVESKQADVIVLWKWSRLSRSRKDWALAADRVDVAGGRIESATEPIDTATASGRFARGVMTEYAAFQSEQIGEQWGEVRQRRFNLGLPPTGSVPYGWGSKKTHIEPVPGLAETVKEMYRQYLSGKGYSAISAWLNRTGVETLNGRDWIPVTVKKILDSPIHAGYVTYKGELRDGAHEGIISREDWERYQTIRKDRHVPTKIRESKYLMSSLMVCHCGRKMYGKKWTSKFTGELHYSYTCPSTTGHTTKSRNMGRVDTAVGEWVKSLETIQADPSASLTEDVNTEAIAREIQSIEKQLVKLTEHLLTGLVPESAYKATRDQLTARSAELSRELEQVERSRHVSPAAYLVGTEDLLSKWHVLGFEDKQRLVRSLIKHVDFTEEKRLVVHSLWGSATVIDT